jgi:hypothetical protein
MTLSFSATPELNAAVGSTVKGGLIITALSEFLSGITEEMKKVGEKLKNAG